VEKYRPVTSQKMELESPMNPEYGLKQIGLKASRSRVKKANSIVIDYQVGN